MSEIDLKCVQNNDVQITCTLTRADGTAVNLTAATIKFVIVDSYTFAVKVTKTTSSGITVSNAAGGVFVVTVDKEDIDDLLGGYLYEVVVTDSDGNVGTMTDENNDAGTFIIRKQFAAP